MDGTSLASGMAAGEGSSCSVGRTRGEDLAESGWSARVDCGGYLKEIESGGVMEDTFEFLEARTVGGDEGAMGGWVDEA